MERTDNDSPLLATLREFLQLESAGGILLLATAVVAMLIANSPLAIYYDAFLDTPVAVQIGALAIDKPLLLWINDGLMAVFFFLVGVAMLLRLVTLPPQISWGQLLGTAFACGIGFTMSLFIAGLAFAHGGGDYFAGDRLGILLGSLLSALAALAVLHLSLPRRANGIAAPGEQ